MKHSSIYLLPEGWFGNREFSELPWGSVSAGALTQLFVTVFVSSYW